MQAKSVLTRSMTLLFGSLVLLVSTGAVAQSAADNIRPVGSVCLAGQPCVGSPADDVAAPASSPAPVAAPAATPAPAAPAPAVTAPVPPAPAAATPAATEFDAAAVYQQSCFACHASGAAGAPVLGDSEAWDARMEKGMDAVMSNVINGVNAMPAKGLCIDCSDDDLRAIVDYMLAQ